MKVILVLGTRPQIIKSALLIELMSEDKDLQLDMVHTGQHYDYEMSQMLLEELNIPDPMVNLDARSGSHAHQTARIMTRLERVLLKRKPDLVMVPGDTNSALAGALVASKLHIPVAHMEAGARSFDMSMPEEINRRLIDHCSSLLFAPTRHCWSNLYEEKVRGKIERTGDTMYDILLSQLPKAENSNILERLYGKHPNILDGYVLLTAHRPENVDNPHNLKNIIDLVDSLKPLTVIFPVHPRTSRKLTSFKLYNELKQDHVTTIKPVSYHESIKLIKNARLLLTDSGGMQKEALWLKTPCVTLRSNTEWPETVLLEVNFLAGTKHLQRMMDVTQRALRNEQEIRGKLDGLENPFGKGEASKEIVKIIREWK